MRETPRAGRAWADYLALGPGRSLLKLQVSYRTASSPPTRRLKTIADWSRVFGWQGRLQALASQEARAAEQREAAYRREILETGYALSHERVAALKMLADRLLGELTAEGDDSRLWVTGVKQLGGGKGAQRVEIERFNAAEVEQFRGLLDDVAREMGERVKRTELSGRDGGPMQVEDVSLTDDERIRRLRALLSAGAAGGPG